jgi:transposase
VGSEEDQKTVWGTVFPTNALALMVQTELKLDPHSGVTVVFRSKRGDRLKILVWDGTGMVLIYKVLEQGNFAWVKTGPEGINPSSGRIEGMNARRAGGAGRHDAAVAGTVRGAV